MSIMWYNICAFKPSHLPSHQTCHTALPSWQHLDSYLKQMSTSPNSEFIYIHKPLSTRWYFKVNDISTSETDNIQEEFTYEKFITSSSFLLLLPKYQNCRVNKNVRIVTKPIICVYIIFWIRTQKWHLEAFLPAFAMFNQSPWDVFYKFIHWCCCVSQCCLHLVETLI